MAILAFDGKRAAPGPICLYHLTNGMLLYSELPPVEDDGVAIFDTRRTLLVQIQPPASGVATYNLFRADRGMIFGPTTMRVPATAMVFAQNCTDDEFLRKCGEALSGLALPGAPPDARVN